VVKQLVGIMVEILLGIGNLVKVKINCDRKQFYFVYRALTLFAKEGRTDF